MSKKILLLLFSFLFAALFTVRAGISLDVKIYTGYKISSFTVMPIMGKYIIYDNETKVAEVLKNDIVKFTVNENKVKVSINNKEIGSYLNVSMSGAGYINAFKLKPLVPAVKERTYDDDLRLSVNGDIFLLVNHVDIEHYVAGVVQSEGGGGVKDNEFYLVQTITCRTYALNNMKKHAKEGYNLCDSVHCQLYYGRCKNSDILAAVYKTVGDVIVDKDDKMIAAAFHANSGGQTVNSEDIWKISTTYLKSVEDTFSLKMPSAKWEKKISKQKWFGYLAEKYNYPIDNPEKLKAVRNFSQEKRLVYLVDSIKLTSIRTDFGLRSTFFSIIDLGDTLLFKGRGYGHGVGLSQQGAIRMAQLGFTYKDIIRFYYKDVEIINYEQLMIK
jgi:stage II sporulation protein D